MKPIKLQFFIFCLYVAGFLLINACSTRQLQTEANYRQILRIWSRSAKNYEGLHNTMQAEVIVFHPRLVEQQIQYRAEIYGWNNEKIFTEAQLNVQKATEKIRGFVAFFTPERRQNNLTSKNSTWNIFLDVDQRRIPAEIKRSSTPLPELRLLYPQMTQWHVPYDIEFNVPFQTIMNKPFRIHISGPIGHQEFQFQNE